MQKEFEEGLRGTADEAIATQKQIAKYYERCGSSGHAEAAKHQLIFATKIVNSIAKCDLKHAEIYCNIITQTFGDTLKPEMGIKYWDAYVDSIRYFHYGLVTKKKYKMASDIYYHVSLYHDKLENESVCLKLVSIYAYHLYLQASLLDSDKETAFQDANHAVENLTYLFQEMLQKNKQLNFQYKDVLKVSLQSIFPPAGLSKINKFFNVLPAAKLAAMFDSLFELSSDLRMPLSPKEEREQYATYVIGKIYNFLNFDVNDKSQLQLSVRLLRHCRSDNQLKADKSLNELIPVLYEYFKLLFSQNPISNFEAHFVKLCERFKAFFDTYSKSVAGQAWFRDFLVVFNSVHTQLQNTIVFACFWKQMSTTASYKILLSLLMEVMKLCPCITADSKLNWSSCCSSFRKHVILSFAQAALSSFVLYCQNMKDGSKDHGKESSVDIHDYEDLHKNLILILNHAFKIVEKMDCIRSTTQEVTTLVLRFKQASVSAKTPKHAKTCVTLCELFLKIKSKIADNEWPPIIRRVYKVVEQCMPNKIQLKRELQMCYIASMLQLPSEMDFTQIRAQICIYYSQNGADAETEDGGTSNQPHHKCLLDMYEHSTNVLKPHMEESRKKILHWLEMQTILKYYKQNVKLWESLLKCCQSQYDYVMIARTAKPLSTEVLSKLKTIKSCLELKTKESVGSNPLEQLIYGHSCVAIFQDEQNISIQNASKFDSKEFSETQLEQLLTRKEMEALTINNEVKRVASAVEAFTAFEAFYCKFDQVGITSDDAVIDWEAIVEDLAILAQFLHLGGYIEYCSQVWLLHYNISQLIQYDFAAFKSLTFMCEYIEFYKENTSGSLIDLDKEIENHLPALTRTLDNLATLSVRKQNIVLLAIIQIAYHYARCSKYTYAAMLIKYVKQKHIELHGNEGRYDVVLGSLDIVCYRLIWKTIGINTSNKQDNLRLTENLMHKFEETLDRFRFFVYSTPCDSIFYTILICNLLQDIAECAANRLYENICSSLFVAVCKCALSNGLALRMVQIMRMWMWINLQMEYVDEAHTKLKLIEHMMGVTSIKEPSQSNLPITEVANIKSNTNTYEPYYEVPTLGHNNGIEAMRRLAHVQLSPIKTTKLQLHSTAQNIDLNRYFVYKIENNPKISIEDYEQLDIFYEKCMRYFRTQQYTTQKLYFHNFHLMAMQHYVNFLRASEKNEKAKQCLEYALELCAAKNSDIDVVYRVNFRLQLLATSMELNKFVEATIVSQRLSFNLLPEDVKEKHEEAKSALKNRMLQQAMGTCKKQTVNKVAKATTTSSSGSSSPETKCKIKSKLKFNICEDPIEISDSDDNIDVKSSAKNEHTKTPERTATTEKQDMPTANDIIDNMQHLKLIDGKKKTSTESRSRKTPTVQKATTSVKLPEDFPHQKPTTKTAATNQKTEKKKTKETQAETKIIEMMETLDLTESKKKSSAGSRTRKLPPVRKPNASSKNSDDSIKTNLLMKPTMSSSSSSLDNNENVENQCKIKHVYDMENVQLSGSKPVSVTRSRIRKKPGVTNSSTPIIILNDSPIMKTLENNVTRSRSRIRNNKASDMVKGATTKNVLQTDISTSSSRLRREKSPRRIL